MKRAHLLGLALLALLLPAALLIGFEGCSKPEVAPADSVDGGGREKPGFYLEKALAQLRKASTSESDTLSRAAVEELNNYLKAQQLRFTLDAKDRSFLKEQLHLDPKELEEVGSRVFTPLDTYHLHFCSQQADVARSLDLTGLPTLERARRAFDWVIRQVNLKERADAAGREENLLPPQVVLPLGQGMAQERALIFLALLEQLRIDGCMVAFPAGGGREPVYWIPGVRVGKSEPVPPGIYLFDTRLGLPLPGPKPGETARLDQVMKSPQAFRALFPDGGERVIPDDVPQAEVYLAVTLSALAPRMRHLEQKLTAADKMVLAADPVGLQERFRAATDRPVRFWSRPGDENTPVRLLRSFLLPREGGVGNKGQLLRFQARNDPTPVWHKNYPRDLHPTLYSNLDGFIKSKLLQYWVQARALLVRGRFDDAVKPVNAGQGYLEWLKDRYLESTRNEGNKAKLDELIKTWCENAKEAQLALTSAMEETKAGNAAAQRQLDSARGRISALFKEDTAPFSQIAYTILAEPLGKEGGYLLCLCLQEKAERNQTHLLHLVGPRGAGNANRNRAHQEAVASWRNADNQWKRYEGRFALNQEELLKRFDEIVRQPGNVREAFFQALDLDISRTLATRLFRARALENMGQTAAALKVLEQQLRELKEMEKSLKGFQKRTQTDNVFWLGLAVARQADRLKKGEK